MVRNNTLGEQVHEIIRENILTGRYKPGERLFFEVIAKETGVSMTPVKEAFMLLEKEGLAVTVARKGTFVRELSKRDILEYYQIRLSLESLAVDLICAKGLSQDDERKLEEICRELAAHIEAGDANKCIAADVLFHKQLVSSSENRQLFQIINTLPLTNLFTFARKAEYYLQNAGQYLAQHRNIIRLLSRKEPESIKEILRSHITTGDHSIMVAMESNGHARKES